MKINHLSEEKVWENQQKLRASELRLGHFVAQLSTGWEKTPFLIQGFVICEPDELAWIQNHCDWAIIDLKKSRKNQVLMHAIGVKKKIAPQTKYLRTKALTKKSMKASLSSYLNLREHVQKINDYLRNLEAGDIRTGIVIVSDVAKSLSSNLPALVWLTRIKHEDEYTAEHCMNVCILAMGLATSLQWDQTRVAQVGVAGLLHDLGKIDLDKDLLNKPGKLTKEEFDILKQHPLNGYLRLRGEPDLTPSILNGILHHHERPDGQGYPDGQKSHEIDDMAKVVSIVDAYDAITSNRVYQKARSHHDAMGILWAMRDKQFDKPMVETFIQFLGWVTPGTLVELSSGDLAIVVQAIEGQRLYPKVRVLMPTNKGYTLGAMWDLSTMEYAENDAHIHIANVLPDGHRGIKIETFAERLFD